ncbi:hypothetical protein [Tsukamurella soli]|uniref:hypothetical protein n=1 Tax=Tsukamurella soli TaxID=644556 RepID=UPI003606D89B
MNNDAILPRAILANMELTELSVAPGITFTVALADTGPRLLKMGLSGSFHASTWRDYGETRLAATQIMVTSGADGIKYMSRHLSSEPCLLLVDRTRTARGPLLETVSAGRLDRRGTAQRLVLDSLGRLGLRVG